MSILRIVSLTCYPNCGATLRCPLINYGWKGNKRIFHIGKKEFNTRIRQCVKKDPDKSKGLSYTLKFSCAGIGTVVGYIWKSQFRIATCEARFKVNEIEEDRREVPFRWKQFFAYLYPHIWYLLASLLGALIVSVLNIWIPQCVGNVVNVLTKGCQSRPEDPPNLLSELAKPAYMLARAYIAQAAFTFVYIYTLSHVGERLAMKLRQDLFRSIIMQDIAFFDKNRTGEIVSRLMSDIQDFKSTFKICISQGLRSITQIIGCVISVIVVSPQLTSAMVLCLPTVVLIGSLLGKSLRKLSAKAQDQVAKTTSFCEEAVQNIRTVRAFAAEDTEVERFSKEVELSSDLYERLGFGISLLQAGTNLLLNGIVLSTLYFGGHLLCTGQLSPGNLMAFLMATQTIQRSLSQLSVLYGSYLKGISAGARIFEYLNMPPSPMMINGEVLTDQSLAGNIVFQDVQFSYPTRPDQLILKNFNLNIPAGKTVAIVGSSGNGKTTVAMLLERLYDVDKGSIIIDGYDIRSLNSSYLRGNVLGYIDQEPILFATSIMENIKYGKKGATDEEVIEAAKKANAHDFIIKFPNGYKTEVGERGAQLSGGQRQRIAIARAILKRPSILILDEATSALDYESERVVLKALENATQGKTVLVIAHRLSTVKNANIIVVLQRGVIAEMGTHDELIKKKGAYYTLVREQEKEA